MAFPPKFFFFPAAPWPFWPCGCLRCWRWATCALRVAQCGAVPCADSQRVVSRQNATKVGPFWRETRLTCARLRREPRWMLTSSLKGPVEHVEWHRFIINDHFICCVYVPKRVPFSCFAVTPSMMRAPSLQLPSGRLGWSAAWSQALLRAESVHCSHDAAPAGDHSSTLHGNQIERVAAKCCGFACNADTQ